MLPLPPWERNGEGAGSRVGGPDGEDWGVSEMWEISVAWLDSSSSSESAEDPYEASAG
jgi:hypothetical protein